MEAPERWLAEVERWLAEEDPGRAAANL
jgi:predicted transcriptional regulator